MQGEAGKGTLAMIGACTVWGLSPLFYAMLTHVPAAEVMAHRILWSLVFFLAILAMQARLPEMAAALRRWRVLRIILLSAAMISVNWFLFILSIQIGRAVEASLGYYIFPLVAVLLGRFVFAERLDRLQWTAVTLAALAVALLTWGLGVAPWISLILASTFGIYGILKKRLDLGPVISVCCEVAVVAPFAAAFVLWLAATGQGAMGGDWIDGALLIASGPVTAVPLILFSYAARRITMGAMGVLQYVNPTLQFLVAVLVLAGPFGPWHAAAFALIWMAVGLYSASALRRDRASRRAARASSAPPTVVT
jgi:chloramphenicol-sensitive protein RarD